MPESAHPDEPERVVVRDKRRVDPHGDTAKPPAPEPDPEADVPKAEALLVEERTRDLQRVQAEYANYRKRAERDRLAAKSLGAQEFAQFLLPVLDDIDRAQEHGDVQGPWEAIVSKFDRQLAMAGLVAFGSNYDPFDPEVHEAVTLDQRDDVEGPVVTTVMRKGYKFADRLVRPAMVGVSEPPPGAAHDDAAVDAAAAASVSPSDPELSVDEQP